MDNGFDFKRLIFSRSSGTIGCWAAALIYSLLLNLVNL
ncbi:hypothetical protein OESDEN_19037 [Oesophagostomum dentatum]|nr:hypothetical protein OESDEN_19037 [Oesophagostomum dentatum]